jgi:lipopolysaccharide transport system permease protein
MVFAALVPWTYFAKACQGSVTSLVAEMPVISKVYFPRITVLLAAVLSRFVDFLACCAIYAAMMIAYGVFPSPLRLLCLPVFIVLLVATALTVGLWTASLTVRFRDVRFVVEYGMQVLLFLSPVAYSADVISTKIPQWMWLYQLNPLFWIIEGFRWSLTGNGTAPAAPMLISAGLVAVLLLLGTHVFRRTERTLVDYL